MVIEAVSAEVRMIPLENLLVDYDGTGQPYPGRLFVAEHPGFAGLTNGQRNACWQFYLSLIGHGYDTSEIRAIIRRLWSWAWVCITSALTYPPVLLG